MGLFSGGANKAKQVELQNIIFGTNEKKLMVSDEFLEKMTKQYISKRMKNINQLMDGIFTTKSAKTFFTYIDTVMSELDELIAIQKYHEFKKPVPSEFKKNIEAKKEKYIFAMINRVWKNANLKANFDPTSGEKRDPEQFAPTLDALLEFRDRYSNSALEHIDRFYKSVYGHGMNETPPEDEAAEEEAAAAAEAEAAAEDIPDEAELKAEEAEMKLNE